MCRAVTAYCCESCGPLRGKVRVIVGVQVRVAAPHLLSVKPNKIVRQRTTIHGCAGRYRLAPKSHRFIHGTRYSYHQSVCGQCSYSCTQCLPSAENYRQVQNDLETRKDTSSFVDTASY